MTLTLWDYLLIAIVMIGIPLYERRTFADHVKDVRERGEPARIAGYRFGIAELASAAALLVALWLASGREWSALGFRAPVVSTFALGSAIAIAVLFFMAWQLRNHLNGLEPGELTKEMGDLGVVLPVTEREQRWFTGLSISAGVSEEMLFRGYLMWALEPVLGVGLAAASTVVLFTLAHIYQGWRRLPGITVAATLMIVVYLVSGSLWVPIALHAAADILQGSMLANARRRTTPPAAIRA